MGGFGYIRPFQKRNIHPRIVTVVFVNKNFIIAYIDMNCYNIEYDIKSLYLGGLKMKEKRMLVRFFTVSASVLLLMVGAFAWANIDSFVSNSFFGSGAHSDDDSENGETALENLVETMNNDISDEDVHQQMIEEMLREAEEAVTPEQRAETEQIREELDEFFGNLSYETIWQAFIDENPERFAQMSEDELLSKSQFIEESLELWEAWEAGELLE